MEKFWDRSHFRNPSSIWPVWALAVSFHRLRAQTLRPAVTMQTRVVCFNGASEVVLMRV
uniref:Uncharacterized protein n=1 Tax=Anguilla anguilla TaxID=7936 RepID=A0A0E9P9Q3_ANGAN